MQEEKIKKSLDENIKVLKKIFVDCNDVISRKIPFGKSKNIFFYVTYIDMMVDRELIETQIINGLMHKISFTTQENLLDKDLSQEDLLDKNNINIFDEFKNYAMTTADIKESNSFKEISLEIMSGNTALLIDGFDTAIIVSSKKFPSRGVSSTEIESVIYGPKDAFTESLRYNTALVRRRIRDINLRIKGMKLGERTQTDIAIIYLEDISRKNIIASLENKLLEINTDAILDAGYIREFIEKYNKSIFPQTQITERPDKTASAILEGRVAIITDNSPFALIIPATVATFFQSSEDYYERYQIMSFLRVLRYCAAILAVVLPGLFIALTLYHPNMLPLKLILKLANERKNIPVSSVFELIIMELTFDLLNEASIRLPNPIGSSIGIVGGIIVGQAAVSAGLVTPIVIIVVALTATSSFAVPNASFVSPLRLLKYFVIFFSATLGLFGFWISILIILIHLASLESFEIPYLYPFVSGEINNFNDYKDTFFRLPICKMKHKPIFATQYNNKK